MGNYKRLESVILDCDMLERDYLLLSSSKKYLAAYQDWYLLNKLTALAVQIERPAFIIIWESYFLCLAARASAYKQ